MRNNNKLKMIFLFIIVFLFELVFLANIAVSSGNTISVEFGETYSDSIDSAAEMDSYIFSANAGDVIFIRMNRLSTSIIPLLKLYAPNGSLILEESSHLYYSIVEYTLQVSGNYELLAGDYYGTGTGNYNIFFQKIINPNNFTSMEIGETYKASILKSAEMDTFVFSASAGDSILIRLNRISGDFIPLIRYYAPNGSLIFTDGDFIYGTSFEYLLPVSGEYIILASDRDGGKFGEYNIFFQKLNNPMNITNIEYGETYSGYIENAAELDSYVFSAKADDVIFVRMNRLTEGFIPSLWLYFPNGSLSLETSIHLYYTIIEYSLPISGNYLILAGDSYGTGTGKYNIFFQRLNNPSNFTTLENNRTYNASITIAAEADTFSFSGTKGDSIFIRLNRISGDFIPLIRYYAPNGSLIFTDGDYLYGTSFEYILPVSGEYTVLASDRDGGKFGEYNIFFQTTGTEHGTPDTDTKEEHDEKVTINEDIPLVEIVTVSTAVAGGTLLIFIGATGLGKYKFLSFLGLLGPLYLKTVREEVFDNQKRLSMYNHITEHQPVIYSEVKRTCKLSDGEINWHAHMMIQLDLIRVERKGFHLFFKLYGKKIADEEFVRLTDTQKSILELINKKPGITQAEIVGKIGLKQQNISYNLLKLEENAKIRYEKVGRVKYYYPKNKEATST